MQPLTDDIVWGEPLRRCGECIWFSDAACSIDKSGEETFPCCGATHLACSRFAAESGDITEAPRSDS